MSNKKMIEGKVKDLLVYDSQFKEFTGIEDMTCYEAICSRGVLVDVVENGWYSIDGLVDLKEDWEQKDNPISLSDGSKGQWYSMRSHKVEFLQKLMGEFED